MKHTPGPWFLLPNEEHPDSTVIATVPKIKGRLDLYDEVLGSSEWIRANHADLRLMAAAPELLASLKKMAGFHQSVLDDNPDHGYTKHAQECIEAAWDIINKAEGRVL